MVARLKLKGIDGRAPPGVNHALAPKSPLETGRLVGWPRYGEGPGPATLSNCGEVLRASATKPAWKHGRWPG